MLKEELTNTNIISNNTAITSPPSLMNIPASQPKRYLNFIIDFEIQLVILFLILLFFIVFTHIIPSLNFTNFMCYSILGLIIYILYYTTSENLWGKVLQNLLPIQK